MRLSSENAFRLNTSNDNRERIHSDVLDTSSKVKLKKLHIISWLLGTKKQHLIKAMYVYMMTRPEKQDNSFHQQGCCN